MYCKKCGNILPDYAEICDKCGTKTGVGSSSKPKINKLIFFPIGVGIAVTAALAITLTFVLGGRNKGEPFDNSMITTTSNENSVPVIIDNNPVMPPASTTGSNAVSDNNSSSQNNASEVVIAGESYPLDTDYINLNGKGVTNADIENLKYLTNLTNIQLQNNSGVTDLTALGGLMKLESLWLDGTGVSDLSPIANCKKLRELGIKNTYVKDISVLSNFTELEKFVAVSCNISDISSVANCGKMQEIWLSCNPITDFSPLVKLNNLETVGLDNCCSMTWDILETLYGLNFGKYLNISGNGVTNEMAEALSEHLYSPDGNGEWWF